MYKILYLLLCLCLCAPSHADGVRLLKQEKGKITFSLKEETLSVYPLTENSIRVIKQGEITHHTPELIYTPVCPTHVMNSKKTTAVMPSAWKNSAWR